MYGQDPHCIRVRGIPDAKYDVKLFMTSFIFSCCKIIRCIITCLFIKVHPDRATPSPRHHNKCDVDLQSSAYHSTLQKDQRCRSSMLRWRWWSRLVWASLKYDHVELSGSAIILRELFSYVYMIVWQIPRVSLSHMSWFFHIWYHVIIMLKRRVDVHIRGTIEIKFVFVRESVTVSVTHRAIFYLQAHVHI